MGGSWALACPTNESMEPKSSSAVLRTSRVRSGMVVARVYRETLISGSTDSQQKARLRFSPRRMRGFGNILQVRRNFYLDALQ
jgi:hypothetical protein